VTCLVALSDGWPNRITRRPVLSSSYITSNKTRSQQSRTDRRNCSNPPAPAVVRVVASKSSFFPFIQTCRATPRRQPHTTTQSVSHYASPVWNGQRPKGIERARSIVLVEAIEDGGR
jgi:hypothetical protein